MKIAIVLCCAVLLLAGTRAAEDTYTNKYDNLDVDMILSNKRILDSYVKCMLDLGRCSPEGRELKKSLPDALVSRCSKCNDKQKAVSKKVIEHMRNKRKQDWMKLLQKYDPTGAYEKGIEEDLKKGKLVL